MRRAVTVLAHYRHNETDGTYSITDVLFTDLEGYLHQPVFRQIHWKNIGYCICDVVYHIQAQGYYIPWDKQFGGRWYNIFWNNTNNHDDHEWKRYGVTHELLEYYHQETGNYIRKVGER